MKIINRPLVRILILLAITIGVGSGFWSITKSSMGFAKPVVVSTNGIGKSDNNQLLQVVSKQTTSQISGFTYLYGLTAYNEAIVSIGLPRQQIILIRNKEKLKRKMKPYEYGDEMDERQYRLNLATLYKKPISLNVKPSYDSDMMPYLSPDGKMILFHSGFGNKYFLYNIKNGETKKLNFKKNSLVRWSNDGQSLLGCNPLNGVPLNYFIYNIYTGKLKNIRIPKEKDKDIFNAPQSKDGKVLYYEGRGGYYVKKGVFLSENKIFELNVGTNTIKTLMNFSGTGTCKLIGFKILDSGKTIVFTALVNNKYGLYTYNVDEKKYYTVIQVSNKNAVKYKISHNLEEIYFRVSHSGDKIVYAIIEYQPGDVIKTTLYAAKLGDNILRNTVSLGTYYNSLRMAVDLPLRWNAEGNKVVYLTNKEFNIGQLLYTDKGQLTTFTFNQ